MRRVCLAEPDEGWLRLALSTLRAQRQGKSIQDEQVQVFHVSDGKATEVWTHPRDQYAMDEFWS